jgi:hypothetical protein
MHSILFRRISDWFDDDAHPLQTDFIAKKKMFRNDPNVGVAFVK